MDTYAQAVKNYILTSHAKPARRVPNLNPLDKSLFGKLQARTGRIIRPTDEGGGIVVVDGHNRIIGRKPTDS